MIDKQGTSRKTVLLVDDDQMVMETLVTTVRRYGYEAIGTANPLKALDRIIDFIQIDAFVVALEMPSFSMDGYEDVICRLKSKGFNVPMLLTTTETSDRLNKGTSEKYKPLDVPLLKKFQFEAQFNDIHQKLFSPPSLKNGEEADEAQDKRYWNNDAEIIMVNMPHEIAEVLQPVFLERGYKVSILGYEKLYSHLSTHDSRCNAVLGIFENIDRNDLSLKRIFAMKKPIGFYSFACASKEKLLSDGVSAYGQAFEKPVNLTKLIQRIKDDAIKAGALQPLQV